MLLFLSPVEDAQALRPRSSISRIYDRETLGCVQKKRVENINCSIFCNSD